MCGVLLLTALTQYLLHSCLSQTPEISLDDVQANYDLWQASGTQSYEMSFSWSCFCIGCFIYEKVITVDNGDITSVEYADPANEKPCEVFPIDLSDYDTVCTLFDILFENVPTANRSLGEFDPVLGYPTYIYIDFNQRIADEELSFSISSLTVTQSSDEVLSCDTVTEECSEYIEVLSLSSNYWNVDTSPYLGKYYYSGYTTSTLDVDYPIYKSENGLAAITATTRRGRRIRFNLQFYDSDGSGDFLIGFWATGRGPSYETNDDGDGYLQISSSNNPFDASSHVWITNSYPRTIDVVAYLNDNCDGLGFDT